ncbi:molybdenum ABC transporter ATP-binding protein ModC [Vibrio paucivorans]|uniref:Molybdenum ABC transporter ATP-binding protein ModC n=1 Tax=Vibrio paucivorans TaxID=2829489 RepID=A0A9X3CGI4_9VIBR|nr:molybdenum ABC transporter ATP-binding protein ModC [Vibrio paucivorans]MCW8335449.1 molybdenum ABC transporter ATP-binding protein ModC [Vibrio paucivorans]
MLTINISKQFGDLKLEVNTQLPLSGVTAVFGRSGAGKTSLVNILGGLSAPDNGEIRLGNTVLYQSGAVNLPPEKRRIGYVFQESRLFPHYKVRGNLNYGVEQKDAELFERIVALLGLDHLLERYPATLSGGEKQRVAIGRALLTKPDMLLMDEPLASLDMPRKKELIPYLQTLSKALNLPVIYVSHSLDEILQLADHMLVLNQGKLIAQGPLTQVWNSEEMRPWLATQELSSLIYASVVGKHPKYAMTKLELDDGNHLWVSGDIEAIDANDKLKVRIEANHVSICTQIPQGSSIRNLLKGEIRELHISESGEQVQLKLALGTDELWANVTPWACDELELHPGKMVYAQIKGVSMGQTDIAHSH